MKQTYNCCDLAGTPHIHTFGEDENTTSLDTKFSVSFFLQDGLKLPVAWVAGSTYSQDDLVVYGTGPSATIWYFRKTTQSLPSAGEEWSVWAARSSWKERWGKYSEYMAGDIAYTYDGIYKCVQNSPAGVYPADSICSKCIGALWYNNNGVAIDHSDHITESDGRWIFLDTIGKKFPPWMKHPSIFTLDIDIGQTQCVHPTTGAPHWDLPNEHYIGHEVMPIEREHATIQKLFREHGKSEVTKIYTAKIIHCGKCTPPATIDEPNPKEQNFFGLTIGAYIIPPETFVMDDSGDNLADSGGVFDPLENVQNLLPMVSPQTGEPFSVIYLQWQAGDMPFIAQPIADNCSVMSSFLCLINREPHSMYMNIFSDGARAAHHGNMIDTSADTFKREFINECIRTGKPVPRGNISADYKKWNLGKMIERTASMTAAQKLWDESNQKWLDWLWNLRQKSEKIRAQCDFIAQDHYGIEKWINSGPKSIRTSAICWNYVEQTHEGPKIVQTSIADILSDLEAVERIWNIMENSIGGLMSYYIRCVEDSVAKVMKKISHYKFKDAINKADSKKKHSRRGK